MRCLKYLCFYCINQFSVVLLLLIIFCRLFWFWYKFRLQWPEKGTLILIFLPLAFPNLYHLYIMHCLIFYCLQFSTKSKKKKKTNKNASWRLLLYFEPEEWHPHSLYRIKSKNGVTDTTFEIQNYNNFWYQTKETKFIQRKSSNKFKKEIPGTHITKIIKKTIEETIKIKIKQNSKVTLCAKYFTLRFRFVQVRWLSLIKNPFQVFSFFFRL